MHNAKALLPNVLILVVNALRVLVACFDFHKNDVKTKPGYKTDLKEAILISNYTCMSTSLSFGFVFIRELCFVMACYDVDYE